MNCDATMVNGSALHASNCNLLQEVIYLTSVFVEGGNPDKQVLPDSRKQHIRNYI